MTTPKFIRTMSNKKLHEHLWKFHVLAVSDWSKPCSRSPEESPYWTLLEIEAERRLNEPKRRRR